MAPSPQKRTNSRATTSTATRRKQSAKQDLLQQPPKTSSPTKLKPAQKLQPSNSNNDDSKPHTSALSKVHQIRDNVEASRSRLSLINEDIQRKRKDLSK